MKIPFGLGRLGVGQEGLKSLRELLRTSDRVHGWIRERDREAESK
jgi:hypothetical protein